MVAAGKGLDNLAREVGEAVDAAGDHVERAVDTAGADFQKAVDKAAPEIQKIPGKAAQLTKRGVEAGFEQFTLRARMVERAWKFLERAANPPWTFRKVAGWALAVVAIALLSFTYHEFHLGVLGLPVLEKAGLDFIAWSASLGLLGLFVFTAVTTLFFLFIPTEPFFFLILATQPGIILPIIAAALGSTVGSCINYEFGRRYRLRAIKKKGDRAKLGKWGTRAHSKWGTAILFLAACLPLPEVVAVAYGLADYPFKKFAAVALCARFVKWTWVALVFVLFRATF